MQSFVSSPRQRNGKRYYNAARTTMVRENNGPKNHSAIKSRESDKIEEPEIVTLMQEDFNEQIGSIIAPHT